MEELQPTSPSARRYVTWPEGWRDWQALALLLILALAIRGWVLWNTEVPARDSIGFIRYALQFEKQDWQQVIQQSHQHPGYPVSILVVSWPIRALAGDTTCDNLQFSAQLAAAVAGWLLVVPMFYLGKLLFNRGVGFWGALLFQCLPGSGPVLSDAVSDPLFLLLFATAFLLAMQALRAGSLWRFSLCGTVIGLAYLVRPEGALTLAATAVSLPTLQFFPRWRRPWPNVLACGGALVLAGLVAGSPYYLVTGCFSNKPNAQRLLGTWEPPGADRAQQNPNPSEAPVLASVFAVHIDNEGPVSTVMMRALIALCGEFSHAYLYVGWLPALLGFWWCRDRYRDVPGVWMGLLLFALQGGLVWWLAATAGYVSDRHVLTLVICSIFQATAVLVQLPSRLSEGLRWLGWQTPAWLRRTCRPLLFQASLWALVLLLSLSGAGLARTLRPLHENRAGHHAAGIWLASHVKRADVIHDDHCWAHFYAGRVLQELNPDTDRARPGERPHQYVVISRISERRPPTVERRLTEREVREMGGEVVYRWPEQSPLPEARVLVYDVRAH